MTVDTDAAHLDEPAHAGGGGQLHQALQCIDVDRFELIEGCMDVEVHTRKVEHIVHTFQGGSETLSVANILDSIFDVGANDPWRSLVNIDRTHCPVACREVRHEVGANEAAGARHQRAAPLRHGIFLADTATA